MSRRERLRLATHDQHTALDRMIGDENHFGSMAGYAAWLRGGLGFHQDMARALSPSCATHKLPIEPLHQRTALLERDLADLGLAPAETPPNQMSTCASEPEAMGALYVTEGAALGSRVLLVRARNLGLTETRGARQLAFAAYDLAPWKSFLALLEAGALSAEQEHRMVTAARQAFAAAMVHLSRRP